VVNEDGLVTPGLGIVLYAIEYKDIEASAG